MEHKNKEPNLIDIIHIEDNELKKECSQWLNGYRDNPKNEIQFAIGKELCNKIRKIYNFNNMVAINTLKENDEVVIAVYEHTIEGNENTIYHESEDRYWDK